MQIRILGDVHSKQEQYIKLVKDCECSIQLGDLGFNYDRIKILDSNKHKYIPGNHDWYSRDTDNNLIKPTEHRLDDFGIIPRKDNSNISDIFYVRGGYSIDKVYRTEGKDWFRDEELTYTQMLRAIELYEKVKPEIVLSHECPASMIPYVANPNFAHLNLQPSATAKMLEMMYKIHQPKFWFFGHHHRDRWVKTDPTNFFCLNELSCIDLVDTEYGYDVISGYYNISEVTPV